MEKIFFQLTGLHLHGKYGIMIYRLQWLNDYNKNLIEVSAHIVSLISIFVNPAAVFCRTFLCAD